MNRPLTYLDGERLQAIDVESFRNQEPYPWINPEYLLHEEAHRALIASLPDLSRFEKSFGTVRAHGQKSHDRYALEYEEGLDLSKPWRDFISELEGPVYHRFLRQMLGTRWFCLRYHWHLATSGCSISPHCDGKRKLGSHIFYLNTKDDWDPSWGGQTLVLDDRGRFSRNSAPDFDEFDRIVPSVAIGNRSFLFVRKANSWHGMYPICCPEDRMRKVFIVVIDRWTPIDRIRARFAANPKVARP